MTLTKGFEALALRLQEALELSHSDLAAGLRDALREYSTVAPGAACPCCGRVSTGYATPYCCCYCYVVDVFGTAESGEVVYSVGGDMYKAPYATTQGTGTRSHSIDFGAAVDVLPRTVYDVETTEAKEARKARHAEPAESDLTETEITGDVVELKEGAVGLDGSAYLKIIQPGWGSSGYYSPEVLKRDGPKIFTEGLQNFWNHQTEAEESERPEGDLRDLASVLTENAKWLEDGPAGPGLYAKAKVFEQFRQPVDDLAKSIGVSIRAAGIAKEGTAAGRTGPIIEKLTRATSVDYVTKPGAGGKVLQLFEAARNRRNPQPQPTEGDAMNEAEIKALQEANRAQAALLKRLQERQALTDAGNAIDTHARGLRVPVAVVARVKRRMLEAAIPTTDAGELDSAKLTEAFTAELTAELDYLESVAPTGRPVNMGTAAAADPKAQEAELDKQFNETMTGLADFFGDGKPKLVEAFTKGRAA